MSRVKPWVAVALLAIGAGVSALAQGVPPPPPPPPATPPPQTRPSVVGGVAQVPGTVPGRGNTTPPKPLVTTGLIVGRVVDSATGRGVSGAVITLNGGTRVPVQAQPGQITMAPAPPPPQFLTDSDGRFAFRFLTRGSYTLQAAKTGYAQGAYARMRPNGASRSLQLDDGEKVTDVTVRLFKYASIAGTVTDELGEPVVAGQVRVYRRSLVAGRRTIQMQGSVSTDDRGSYRVGSLSAGEYLVMVPVVPATGPATGTSTPASRANLNATSNIVNFGIVSAGTGGRLLAESDRFVLGGGPLMMVTRADSAGRWRSYATQWYPSVGVMSGAQPIALSVGEERAGTDFVMRYVPTNTISGQVIAPDGPAAEYVLRLIPNETAEWTGEPEAAIATTDQSGLFSFMMVPSGSYVIQTVRVPQQQENIPFAAVRVDGASAGGPPVLLNGRPEPRQTDPVLFGSVPVSVGDTDVSNIVVMVRPGFTISGRLEFSGTRPRPTAQQLRQLPIVVEAADGRPGLPTNGPQSAVTPEGRFNTVAFLPGRYFIRMGSTPGGWMIQSIMANGVDATEVPVDVTQDLSNVVISLTDQISDVRGSVRGVVAGVDPPSVVIFPSDSTAWKNFGINPMRMKRTVTGSTGAFSFGNMPAGDYFAVSIPDEYSTEWQDSNYLDILSRTAQRFTLSAGERKQIELSVQDVKPPGAGRLQVQELRQVSLQVLVPEVPENPVAPEAPDGSAQQTRDSRPPSSQPAATGSISGVVMQDDGSLKPSRLARVSVRGGTLQGERLVMTADDGTFSVNWLPPGSYQVYVTKASFLAMYYGATRPARGPGTAVKVEAAKSVTDLKITLTRGAVLTGTVFDSEGLPAPNTRVQLMQVHTIEGQRFLQNAALAGTPTTDDRGMYRIYGIRSGTYVVLATPTTTMGSGNEVRQLSEQEMRSAFADAGNGIKPSALPIDRVLAPAMLGAPPPVAPLSGRAVSSVPVFHPGTVAEEQASLVTLVAGQELSGINIALQLVPAARLEGSLTGVDGQPVQSNAQVTLQRVTSFSQSSLGVRMLDGGRFQAMGVAPGPYLLSARYTPPPVRSATGEPQQQAGITYWAQEEIFVNGVDQSNITLTLKPPLAISGRATFEGSGAPTTEVQVRLEQLLRPGTISSSRVMRVERDGTFKLSNVTPGKYRMTASVLGAQPVPGAAPVTGPPPVTWGVKSANVDGREAFESTFEVTPDRPLMTAAITLTTQLPQLTGQLQDQSGLPVTDMALVLFSVDRRHWVGGIGRRIRSLMRPQTDGWYSFTNLLPGNYCLAVLSDLDPLDLNDPAFLEQLLPAGIKITLAEGDKKIQSLKLAGR